MKIIHKFLFVILTVIILSCNTSNQGNEEVATEPKSEDQIMDELYQEVVEVHDKSMMKMQTIMNLKTEAIKEADSLRSLGDKSLAERIKLLEETQITLEEANKSMMTWMREFRPPDTALYAQTMEYLRTEQDKIEEVNRRMEQAIKEAEAL